MPLGLWWNRSNFGLFLLELVHLEAEDVQDELGNDVVLLLRQSTDGAEQLVPTDVRVARPHSPSVGEVSPAEGAIVLGARDRCVDVALLSADRVAAETTCQAHLADGVGDVAVLVGTPASGHPDHQRGVVPAATLKLGIRLRHGKAEARRVADQAEGHHVLDDHLDLFVEQQAEVDPALAVAIDLPLGEAADVQLQVRRRARGRHGYSNVLIVEEGFLNSKKIIPHFVVSVNLR